MIDIQISEAAGSPTWLRRYIIHVDLLYLDPQNSFYTLDLRWKILCRYASNTFGNSSSQKRTVSVHDGPPESSGGAAVGLFAHR